MVKIPRVEVDPDTEEYVVLQSLRSILRVIGFLLFCSVIIMAGLSWNQARLSSKVNKLSDTVDRVEAVSGANREVTKETRDALIGALQESNNPERDEQLARAFQAIFETQAIIAREFGE